MPKHPSPDETEYLFLDFDGVTHPAKAEVDQLFMHGELLASWLSDRPSVRVVISSSWREVHPMDEIRDFFPERMASRIIGATPRNILKTQRRSNGTPSREREAEIRAWLKDHGVHHNRWAALDDQDWRFRSSCRNLVLCETAVGVTEKELEKVKALLFPGKQPPEEAPKPTLWERIKSAGDDIAEAAGDVVDAALDD